MRPRQDVEAVVRTARRRASDGKGGVRKAAVALLEGLLRLRASAAAAAAPPLPAAAVRLPTRADLEPLRGAASDPLVGACPPPAAPPLPSIPCCWWRIWQRSWPEKKHLSAKKSVDLTCRPCNQQAEGRLLL